VASLLDIRSSISSPIPMIEFSLSHPIITLAGPCDLEEDIRKSRFLARGAPVHSPEEALGYLAAVRVSDATHNCWAYRIGDAYRFSDDGEPGGTAGRPILAALEGQGVDHAVVVVTRWYGGIKLGAGGLARAYGGCAAKCLRAAAKRELRPLVHARLEVAFADASPFYTLLDRPGVRRLGDGEYTEDGVVWALGIEPGVEDALRRAVADVTRGAGRLIIDDRDDVATTVSTMETE
jgi:putative IMPACT (imprinted ancient) family translation regulator